LSIPAILSPFLDPSIDPIHNLMNQFGFGRQIQILGASGFEFLLERIRERFAGNLSLSGATHAVGHAE
jgi:hypothetical protein